MTRQNKRLRICTVLLLLNLTFIWGNSLLPAPYSQALSDWVMRLLGGAPAVSDVPLSGSGLLRKLAHFTEFAALGVLLRWLWLLLGRRGWMPFCLGTAAACIDETIQLFVPGRGPGLLDVGIDTCGVAAGILLLQIGYTFRQTIFVKKHGGN